MNLSLVVLATYINPPEGKVEISYLDSDLPPAQFSFQTVVKAAKTRLTRSVTIHCGLNSSGQPFAYAAPPKEGVWHIYKTSILPIAHKHISLFRRQHLFTVLANRFCTSRIIDFMDIGKVKAGRTQ